MLLQLWRRHPNRRIPLRSRRDIPLPTTSPVKVSLSQIRPLGCHEIINRAQSIFVLRTVGKLVECDDAIVEDNAELGRVVG